VRWTAGPYRVQLRRRVYETGGECSCSARVRLWRPTPVLHFPDVWILESEIITRAKTSLATATGYTIYVCARSIDICSSNVRPTKFSKRETAVRVADSGDRRRRHYVSSALRL
jgi:hypothetical protein